MVREFLAFAAPVVIVAATVPAVFVVAADMMQVSEYFLQLLEEGLEHRVAD